jgi:aldehyde dehydrogenase (NAD+)
MTLPDRTKTLSLFGLDKAIPAAGTGRVFLQGKAEADTSISPIDGKPVATFAQADATQREAVVQKALEGFDQWRAVPVPARAAVLMTLAAELRARKDDLAQLMCLEMGKPLREAKAEVEDSAVTAVYAAGLARTIGGLDAPSARTDVQLIEKWHPLGAVLVITAFNFPIALWAWNACIAVLCGNSVLWKPAPQTPLFSAAVAKVVADVLAKHPEVPEGVFSFIMGSNDDVAIPLVNDTRLPLVSATGSTRMGQAVGKACGERLASCILELGGNAAAIFSDKADMELSLRTAFIAALSNGGQRCTALRRLLVHTSRFDEVVRRLKVAYNSLSVAEFASDGLTLPPLVDAAAQKMFNAKIEALKGQKGVTLFRPNTHIPAEGCYVAPHMAILEPNTPQPQDETFGPLLYVQPYSTFEEALKKCNAVEQGLSSGIFTTDLREVAQFTGARGADSGMVAVNDNTGGLEVALAFGGTKMSGLGSEKGSDSWKHYMRRQSIVMNTGTTLPPDLGIDFGK